MIKELKELFEQVETTLLSYKAKKIITIVKHDTTKELFKSIIQRDILEFNNESFETEFNKLWFNMSYPLYYSNKDLVINK